MITLEDLLEEIVGEIRDEYDADEEEDFKEIVPKREYLAKGSAKLDDLNEALDLHLETEDYDSIGGFGDRTARSPAGSRRILYHR